MQQSISDIVDAVLRESEVYRESMSGMRGYVSPPRRIEIQYKAMKSSCILILLRYCTVLYSLTGGSQSVCK